MTLRKDSSPADGHRLPANVGLWRTLVDAGRRFARGWIPVALLLVGLSMLAGIVATIAFAAIEPVARAQITLLIDPQVGGLTTGGLFLLVLQVGVPAALVIGWLAATAFGTALRFFDSLRDDNRSPFHRALLQGVRRSPALLAALVLHLIAIALTLVLTPFIMVLAVIALVVVGIQRARGGSTRVPLGYAVVALIPLGAVTVVIARFALAPALTVLEGIGPVQALRRSFSAVGRSMVPTALAVIISFAAYLALQVGISLALGDLTQVLPIAVAIVVVQSVTFGYPLAVLAVLGRDLRDTDVAIEPLPGASRRGFVAATATALALVMFVTSGAATPVHAATEGAVGDAAPGVIATTDPTDMLPLVADPAEDEADVVAPMGGEVEGGEGEDPGHSAPSAVPVDDPRFTAQLIVREGPTTVEGDPVTLWVTAQSTDSAPVVGNFWVDYFLLEEDDEWQFLGTNQYSRWYEASSLTVDQQHFPLSAGTYSFAAQIYSGPPLAGQPDPVAGPRLTVAHTVDAGSVATVTTLTAPSESVVGAPIPVEVSVTAAGDPVTTGWVRVGGGDSPDLWLSLDAHGVASGSFVYPHAHTITLVATYFGAPPMLSSSSDPVAITVRKLPVDVVLTQQSTSSSFGDVVSFEVVLNAPGGEPFSSQTPVSLLLGDPLTGQVLATGWPEPDGRLTLTTSSLPAGSSLVYAVFNPDEMDQERFARSVSAPVMHGVGVVPVTLTLHSAEGTSLYRGGTTELRIGADVPAGSPALIDGTLTVTIDGDTQHYAVADVDMPLEIPATMTGNAMEITASLSGSSSHAAADDSQLTLTRRAAATTASITLVQQALPGTAHAIALGVAGENPYNAPLGGDFEYRVNGGTWITVAADQGGATVSLVLELGRHTIEARYLSSDLDEFASSVTASQDTEVGLVATTAQASSLAVRAGQSSIVTVSVAAAAWHPKPTAGDVVIEDADGVVLGTGTLAGSSSMTLTLSPLSVGSHELTVRYGGTAQFAQSTTTLDVGVARWATSLTLVGPGETTAYVPTAYTATVSTDPEALASLAGGIVTFTTNSGLELGTATVDADGVAELDVLLPARSVQYQVFATYSDPAGVFDGSSDMKMTYVFKAGTTLTLEYSPTNPAVGQEVQLRARVTVDAPSQAPLGSGFITFGGDFFPTPYLVQPDADGWAYFTVTAPAPGGTPPYTTLQFSGSDQAENSYGSGYLSSRKANVTVTLTPSPGDLHAGATHFAQVSLDSETGATAPNQGTVTLWSGSTELGSLPVTASTTMPLSFTLDAVALGLGTHPLIARYSGGPHFESADSDAAEIVLVGYETGVLLTATPQNSSTVGDTVIATASVDALGHDQVPTGQVEFLVGGSVVGTETLVPVGGTGPGSDRASASLTLPMLAIGSHEITARYLPDLPAFAGSTSIALAHEVVGAATTVYAPFPQLFAGRQAEVEVTVTSAGGVGFPLGTVELWIDGTATGVTRTLLPGAANTTGATIVVSGAMLEAGSRAMTVRYTPDDGIHSPAEYGGAVTVAANTPTITVETPAVTSVEWGTAVFLTVTLGRDAGDTGSLAPLPTGTPTVSLEGGDACVMEAATIFRCTAERTGPMIVNVSYGGDARYAAATMQSTVAHANPRTALLTVDVSSASPETGQAVTLDWNLIGPTVRPTISGLPAGAQCTGDAVGSCEFRYGLADLAAPQELVVEFATTPDWVGAQWSQPIAPIACYPVVREVSPLGAGTVTIDTPANCADGGFRAGTPILVRVAPTDTVAADHRWRLINVGGRAIADPAPAVHHFEVGTGAGQTRSVSAVFEYLARCVTVSNVMSTMRTDYGGQLFVGGAPNCPGDTAWSVTSAPNAHGGRDVTWSGRFLIGTEVASDRPTPVAGYEYYGVTVDGGRFVPWGTVHRILEADLRVVSLFGPACVPVDVEVSGPGSVRVAGTALAASCPDPSRADQFVVGSTVRVTSTPDPGIPLAFLSAFDGPVERWTNAVGTVATSSRSGVTEHHVVVSSTQKARASFAVCAVLQVLPQFKGQVTGTVTNSTASNCPVGPTALAPSTWHYTPGTVARLHAVPQRLSNATANFAKWNIPGLAQNRDLVGANTYEYLSLSVNEDTILRPSFLQQNFCSEFRTSVPSPQLEARFEFDHEAIGYCDEGILDYADWGQGELWGKVTAGTVTGRVRAVTGSPLVGWRVSNPDFGTYGIPGEEVRMTVRDRFGYYGSYRLDAFACQRIVPMITVIDVAGNPHIARQQSGSFIEISPAPNCPFDSSAWIVGTELSFTAGADTRGYSFKNWEGVAGNGSDTVGQNYVVNAEAPEAALMAVYDLVCHKLTITGKPHRVTRLPEANCNGSAEPTRKNDVWTGWYIGGTSVAMIGEVPGGNVWQGWSGDVENKGKVEVAVVVMDADKTVAHSYREKDWDEKAADFFTDAGNELAIAAKKLVGVAGFVANQAFSYVPPVNMVGPILGGLSYIGDMLEEFGVPESVTKYFAYPADTFKWVTDQYLCVAAWGLSGGSASVYLGDYTESVEDWVLDQAGTGAGIVGSTPIGGISGPLNPIGDIDPDDPGEGLDDTYGNIGDGAGLAEIGGADLGKAGAGLGYLDSALTGYKLLTNPQGIGWDDNAGDAWSYDNFNTRMSGCSDAALPDFLREEMYPDRTEEEWAEIDKKYGL